MKYAPMISRGINFLIDVSLISGITFLGLYVFLRQVEPESTVYDFFTNNDFNLILNLYFAVCLLLYYFIFESLTGRTLGKLITGTRVVDYQGNKPTLKKIFLRSLFRIIPIEWISFLKSKPIGWHDSLSDTVVVIK